MKALVLCNKILRNPRLEFKVNLTVVCAKQVEGALIRSHKHHEAKGVLHTAQLPWALNAVLPWKQMFKGR